MSLLIGSDAHKKDIEYGVWLSQLMAEGKWDELRKIKEESEAKLKILRAEREAREAEEAKKNE